MKMSNMQRMMLGIVGALGILLGQNPAMAAETVYNLTAGVTTVTMPGGSEVTMWGYGLNGGPITVPGPALVVPPGNTLKVNLTNDLPGTNPVSIMIPGQAMPLDGTDPNPQVARNDDGRIRSFVHETPNGETVSYIWSDIKPGTYLYQSGTHPAVQVQMGLYGAMTNDVDVNEAYAGKTYNAAITLLYSEIDPALHAAVANETYGTPAYPSTLNYVPKFFLINGLPYSEGFSDFPTVYTGQNVLVRLLNAGLQTHVPVVMGLDLNAIAEDGNLYPYPRTGYSVVLPAGKTVDAMFQTNNTGHYAVFDRAYGLTNGGTAEGGMLTYIDVLPD